MRIGNRRRALAVLTVVAAAIAALMAVLATSGSHEASLQQRVALKQIQQESQGIENGGSGGEANDYATASAQFTEARTAPSGIVAPGAYSGALAQLTGLGATGGAWTDVTLRKYDADSPDYRDYYSNSSGGSGNVTGRITGLAADDAGHVYAAGANGGVWRSSTGGGNWTPITDALPSLSTGDLELTKSAGHNVLWYATGEANTGGTSYVGSGVYRLVDPETHSFSTSGRVGGTELESTTINALRFANGRVWAATLRGIWSHDASTSAGSWTLNYAPNPANLPTGLKIYAVSPALANAIGTGTTLGNSNAAYANIVNDIAVDPKNASHIVAALGWRSGALSLSGAVIDYNGFYESNDGGATFAKINPQGGIDQTDIGNASFAFSGDGSKLYAINQSPRLLNKLTGTVNSYLDGIYVSNNANPAGPWSKIAESQKLANSGSALKQAVGGKGYGPGIQAWYNQSLGVDPSNPNHVIAGLEEVYETTNGGSSWNTIGPYWNFNFSCWRLDATYNSDTGAGNGCPLTTHSDQHSVAFGKDAQGKSWVYVGNDGGVYRRPLNGSTDTNGNATDWQSLNDGTIDNLQYYAVGIGKLNPAVHTITSTGVDNGVVVNEGALSQVGGTASDVLVSGGLQDNGGSLVNPRAGNMVSNFGGDGGDVLVDPNDGCNIVQEYVVLSMTLTQTCGSPDHAKRPLAFVDLSQTTEFKIGPPDSNARFIAPFVKNKQNTNEWLAGGSHLWVQNKGFAIRSGAGWGPAAYALANAGQTYTALAMNGDVAVGGWCGPCNNSGFTRGVTIGQRDATKPSGWNFAEASTVGLPSRFIGGVTVADGGSIYLGLNGFSRRFTEGEGAGVGHIFRYVPAAGAIAAHWDDVSGNFPDIPVNSIQALTGGSFVAGTDLGVLYRATATSDWQRLGPATGTGVLPLTTAMDVELGPDNRIYAATHGRGIWSIAKP